MFDPLFVNHSNMKKSILTLFLCAAAPMAFAQTTTTTTTRTTETTMGTGTVTEVSPNSTIIVREESGPVTYRYGKSVTYVTKDGRTLTSEEVSTRLHAGVPVTVSYSTEGDHRVVNRIVFDEVVEQR